jgi:hypothetical protein
MKTCGDCKYAILQDTGYSNYTVMGMDFHCAKELHPDDGFDWWYGEDKRKEFAEQCAGYEAGEPVSMDVDGENEYTPDEQAIIDLWNSDKSTDRKPE